MPLALKRWAFMSMLCIIYSMHSGAVVRRLERDGWILVRIRGSHHRFQHPDKPGQRVTVPHPVKDIRTGTLRNIYK